jgi:L-cysteine:1D-myo-inositol 2-amino-2-deoxy-alpha-D-glucopyranoside ligase
MYVCGITPYDATHLGHANTYLAFDLLHRYLLATGAKVNFVQNITDIDDPLLERAKRDEIDWRDLATSQIDLFRSDMVALHILPPDHYIGAVDAIPLVVDAISVLEAADSVYKVENDLYFKIHSDAKFGSRSHLPKSEMLQIFCERGGDPDRAGKQDPLDALLWLAQRPDEPGWESKYGTGRPGWHIECCAIALNYLEIDATSTTSIDFQGGGSDLIFPHHEMSAAQSKVMNNKEFASHYVHAGMIGLDGEKMSKSKGNLVFVSQLLREGVDAMVIRTALLRHHYRSDHMWHNSELEQARLLLDELRLCLSRPEVAPTDRIIDELIAALSEDLNTPAALSALQNWMTATNHGESGGDAGELSRAIDALLGIAI